jgi:hypothetical protein
MPQIPCKLPVAIAPDENFALVNEVGWPIFSVYRRLDGALEIFFEEMDGNLSFKEAMKIAEDGVRRWKASSLNEEPDPIEIAPGPKGLQFYRPKKLELL